MKLSQVLKTPWAGGVFRLFNGLEGCPRPRKIGQNHIYFEHIFFASQTLPNFEGNTWDAWDS